MNLSLRNGRTRLTRLNILISGFLAFVVVASFGFNWGVAYGQTAGPTTPAPAGQSTASVGTLSVSISQDKTSLAVNESATIVVRVANNATARGNSGSLEGLSLERTSLNSANLAAPGTVAAVNVVTTFPATLRITEATSTRGVTTITGQTVNSAIGDLPANTSASITYTVVALQPIANLVVNSAASAELDGKRIQLAVTTQTLPNTGAAPVANPSEGNSKVVPGLPNTGIGNSAPAQTSFETWKLVLLAALSINFVVSIAVLARRRRLSQD
jgi:hypothetical protein